MHQKSSTGFWTPVQCHLGSLLLTADLGAGLDPCALLSPGRKKGMFFFRTGKCASFGEQEVSSRSGSILKLQGGVYQKQKRVHVS